MMKTTLLIVLLLFVNCFIQAQEVTTLVNDSSRLFEAIHWHQDGRIYAVDYGNGEIYGIHLDGTVETLGQGVNGNIAGGGFDLNGNFYFSTLVQGVGSVYRLNSDNSYTLIASGFNQPIAILQSSDADTLYVTQYGNSSIAKLSISSGTISPWVSLGGISGPDALIYNQQNELILANFNNTNTFKIGLSGTITPYATLPVPGAMGYLTLVDSDIYVPAISGRKIFKIDNSGNVVEFAGSGLPGNSDGIGALASFSNPNGICSNPAGDTILITDGNRVRIITNFNDLGTNENAVESSLSIYPNPAIDILSVSISPKENKTYEWEIYNEFGEVVLKDSVAIKESEKFNFEVSIQQLAIGSYTFKFFDENNFHTKRSFIKVN